MFVQTYKSHRYEVFFNLIQTQCLQNNNIEFFIKPIDNSLLLWRWRLGKEHCTRAALCFGWTGSGWWGKHRYPGSECPWTQNASSYGIVNYPCFTCIFKMRATIFKTRPLAECDWKMFLVLKKTHANRNWSVQTNLMGEKRCKAGGWCIM